jgi:hypothetical protein
MQRQRLIALMGIVALVLALPFLALAQAAGPQQTVLVWDPYVDPVPVPPATTIPASQQFKAYYFYQGIGSAVCANTALPLTPALNGPLGVGGAHLNIQKVPPPGVTPTTITMIWYPDVTQQVCWSIRIQFQDNSVSDESLRYIKNVVSTKPLVQGLTGR